MPRDGRRHLSSQRPSCLAVTWPPPPPPPPRTARATEGRRGRAMSAALAVARQRLLGAARGGYNAALRHGIQTGVQRLQDLTEKVAAKETESQSLTDLGPLILQRNSMRWDGKTYEEIPIAHIKATYNNTHIQVVSFDNMPFARTSCGTEGFQNAKKGTAIAAQTAGIAAAVKARGKGVFHVRVMVKGLGPGRKAAIKGLTMGGLEVISITDNTPVPHNGCRPRKARRM
ncbi:small ribosomal subunit protein uS11m [Apteryx mantelli]|uniref:Small ribosomal subunit protein uS11m n=1 Tax=Apteryx mantelli TaxID=2696672 RepID=A0ABM4F9I1_9AVES